MLPRKPSLLFNAFNSFIVSPPAVSESSTSSKRKRQSTRQCLHCNYASRTYATIAGDDVPHPPDSSRFHDPHHAWPSPPNGQKTPTPYQILSLDHKAPYTKTRFYQLVKLYHPDRSNPATSTSPSSVTPAIKMERYRLIIAAHDILSDPTKRSAYDRLGAGWNGVAPIREPSDAPAGPFSQNWTHTDPSDPIFSNATWEDWERYYHARARARGETSGVNQPVRNGLYVTNGYFIMIVAALALMGSTANYSRAQNEGQSFIDQKDSMHDRAVRELRRVKAEAYTGGSKSGRVEWFVRNREASLGLPGSDPQVLREERAEKMLPEREVCRSEGISEREKG